MSTSSSLTKESYSNIPRDSPMKRLSPSSGVFSRNSRRGVNNRHPMRIFGRYMMASALMLVLSTGLDILLVVNIIIQYRTMTIKNIPQFIWKGACIAISILLIYGLNKFNLWFYRKLSARSSNFYSSLGIQHGYEMSNL
ncbi:HGL024Wp [Eremothecium sinecaudum]|uniref:HGL024Wp n=1 Tax=Eremothecium sinecaudum TaxID=45286 RepID=A0A0X8HV56_9SACH|nr:HGL024Wp [Eremothecium sinecaudum]AMD22316.1 HGL024Wp [Eremothecium sinecaudum]